MHVDASQQEETEQERRNRQLDQLLNELRVAMPGVQVLFAFLLAVPFQQRFGAVTEFQKGVYFVTLLASAVASALFIAPTAYHRLMFGEGDKARLIALSTKLALAGLLALAVAMNGAVLLVTDVLFDGLLVVATAIVSVATFIGLWFGLGMTRRLTAGRG